MLGEDDLSAHNELVERVVRRLVNELDLSCDPDDLRGWAQQGLLEAKQRFDASRGVRFSTFAYYRVRGAVLDGVRSQAWIKRRAYAKLKAVEAVDALAEQTGEAMAQAPSASLAARADAIDDVLGKVSAAFVISAVGQGDERAPETPESLLENEEQRVLVKSSLDALPERERTLLTAMYFEGITLEAAGARLGLSKSWASRLHAKALERMKKSFEARHG